MDRGKGQGESENEKIQKNSRVRVGALSIKLLYTLERPSAGNGATPAQCKSFHRPPHLLAGSRLQYCTRKRTKQASLQNAIPAEARGISSFLARCIEKKKDKKPRVQSEARTSWLPRTPRSDAALNSPLLNENHASSPTWSRMRGPGQEPRRPARGCPACAWASGRCRRWR